MRHETRENLTLAFFGLVVVGLLVVAPLWATVYNARAYDAQTSQLEAQCIYKGQRAEGGFGGGTVEIWDCAGAHFERWAQ